MEHDHEQHKRDKFKKILMSTLLGVGGAALGSHAGDPEDYQSTTGATGPGEHNISSPGFFNPSSWYNVHKDRDWGSTMGGAALGGTVGGAVGYGIGSLGADAENAYAHGHKKKAAFINGFVKRAADYGIAENHAVELCKNADVNGAYSVDHASKVKADDERLKGLVSNRKNHLGHYLLNPFVGGPLTEALTRLSRRGSAARTGKGGWGYDAASMISPLGSGVAAMTFGGRKENRVDARQIAGKNNLDSYHSV